MIITNRLTLLLPLWFLLIVGCGGSKGTVARLSGNVKYKGAPVTAGTIAFTAKGEGSGAGGTYLASINPDGTYSTSQLPAGEFTVAIETESANPKRASPERYGGGKGMDSRPPEARAAAKAAKGAYVKIPSKYASPKTSGLTVTLTSGKNTKDFDLTD